MTEILKASPFFTLAPGPLASDTYTDPWVFQSFRGRDALRRVDSEHFVDEIFGFRSHCVPLW